MSEARRVNGTAVRPSTIAALLGVLITAVSAMPSIYDIRDVPVDRLVANIERQVRDNPRDPRQRLNLARTHMMAYALKTPTLRATLPVLTPEPVPTGTPYYTDWQGGNGAPISVAAAPNDAARRQAAAHLTAALQEYEAIVALDPQMAIARIGYAWALQEAGERAKAIAQYRAAIAIDTRAIAAAIPASVADAGEIAELTARRERLARTLRGVTPLVVPLRDGAGPDDLVDPAARVLFDADGSARSQRWTWITSDAGWLVFNPQHRPITSALQMFGNVTFWLFWENGYDALRSLDDNADGRLRDRELDGIEIWRDANGNGISDAGELQSVATWHIRELSVEADRLNSGEGAIAFSPAGVTFDDGRTRATYDLLLYRRN